MRKRRGRLLRAAVIWTLLMLAIAVLLAAQAMISLVEGQQACFFGYSTVACPATDDPAVVRLTFAFFGVPLIWLVGIGLSLLLRAGLRRRSAGGR